MKLYRLRLTEREDDYRAEEQVTLNLEGSASSTVGWLLSVAETITQDDPKARERLEQQARVLIEQLERRRGWKREKQ